MSEEFVILRGWIDEEEGPRPVEALDERLAIEAFRRVGVELSRDDVEGEWLRENAGLEIFLDYDDRGLVEISTEWWGEDMDEVEQMLLFLLDLAGRLAATLYMGNDFVPVEETRIRSYVAALRGR